VPAACFFFVLSGLPGAKEEEGSPGAKQEEEELRATEEEELCATSWSTSSSL